MLAIENKNYNYVENRSDVRDYKMPRRKTTRRSRRRPKEEGGDEGKETGGGDGGGGEGGGGIGGGGGVGGGGGGKGGREGGDERVASPDGGEGRVQGGELDADYLPVRKTHCTKKLSSEGTLATTFRNRSILMSPGRSYHICTHLGEPERFLQRQSRLSRGDPEDVSITLSSKNVIV